MFPMSLIVQKFGGTSVADTDSLRIVAERIIDCKKNGNDVVVFHLQWVPVQMN